ncbi:MAG: proprotein convertase P-domain-containing protein [Myxococcota bacterium]
MTSDDSEDEVPEVVGPLCGNGLADPGEDCDDQDLGGVVCSDINAEYAGGHLACTAQCRFETSACLVATHTRHCETVDQAIPDGDPIGVSHAIELPSPLTGRTIIDVDVEIEVDHDHVSDLVIGLTHHGETVVLHDGCGGDDLDATYDDESGSGTLCPSSGISSVVEPVGWLAEFDGTPVETDWVLSVRDLVQEDTGAIERWCVTVSSI